MSATPRTLLNGLCFPEGPRWREGKLIFSDMHAKTVLSLDLDGKCDPVARVEAGPSGLGWLPDGRMLIVSMTDRRLLRLELDGSLSEVADLSSVAQFHCNDMVVDRQGRAYVGNFGWDLHGGGTPTPADLVMVTPEGDVRVVATDLEFPNGTVISEDGRTMIIGETMGRKLTAFDIAPDGALERRREWATLDKALPDGICLDAEGAVWVASPISHGLLRVLEGGEVTDRIEVENQAFACMLGGPERRHLFICTAASSHPEETVAARNGRIEVVEVSVPGAGIP